MVDSLDGIRQVVKKLRSEGMSRPDILRLVGVRHSNDEALIKALSRFEGGAGLPSDLRGKFFNHFRHQFPEVDILDFSLFADEEASCKPLYPPLREFYNIRKERVDELKKQVSGRYFIYKRPVSSQLQGVLRSYAKFEERPGFPSPFMMALVYDKIIYEGKATGLSVGQDFYSGLCVKKDSSFILFLRQHPLNAIRHMFFDQVGLDAPTGVILFAWGHSIETCDSFSKYRLVTSPCAMERIPDHFTHEKVNDLVGLFQRKDIDEMFSNHILGPEPKT